jgi:putative transposase
MTASNCVTEEQLQALGLPDVGIEYVLNVYESPPDRKVGRKRRRNLVLDVPMPRLGVSLQAESLSGEFFFLVQLNDRDDVCAVYDQPISVALQIVDRIGRHSRVPYTGDYLVVDQKQVAVYEVKADSELERLTTERPSDWSRHVDGYHYIPAEKYFSALGIRHFVVPISELSSIRGDNLRLLHTSRRCADTKPLRKMRRVVREIVSAEHAIRVGEIMDRLECSDATAILQLIDKEEIFAALDHITLSDIRNVWVCATQSDANIVQESDKHLTEFLRARSELGVREILGGKYYTDVAVRLAIVDGVTKIGRRGKEVSARTLRRYRRALKDSGGDIRCLQPRWSACGNSDLRISSTHMSHITRSMREGRQDKSCSSVHGCYVSYKESFSAFAEATELFHERPVVRSTYYLLWDMLPYGDSDLSEKGGRRLQNALSDVYDPTTKTIIATRAFETAHIDHWKADLFVVLGYVNGKKITARPWVTAMVDSFSGEILALWMSLSAPSKKSCTMVIRDCVRRHGRLPEMLVVDGGAEFKSVHFAVMLATLGVIRCERPPEDPRFGKEVERLFGQFKERFARGLPGYGLSIEQSRAISGAFKAHRTAKLTTSEAFEILERYAFHGYNFSKSSSSTVSTRTDVRIESISIFPCSGVLVEWDLRFMIATSIDAPGSGYTLFRGRGIHVDGHWYTSPKLLRYYGHKKDIDVRLEPFDTSVVYVCIDEKWLLCRNTSASIHAAFSDQRLINEARERYELRALRRELQNECDACAAAIVRAKLEEIGSRSKDAHSSTSSGASPTQAESAGFGQAIIDDMSLEEVRDY